MTITSSHLRRLAATIFIGCVILLPPFMGRAPAQSECPASAAAATATLASTAAL